MGDRPADADDVDDVLRFGWAITELRGRYTQGLTREKRPKGLEQLIPLKWERSRHERAIEAKNTVKALAIKLGFDKLAVTGQHGKNAAPLDKLKERTDAIVNTISGPEPAQRALVTFLRFWDEAIQDAVVARSPSMDAAFQLARGLADVRWSNDLTTEAPIDDHTWTFYLGPARREQLTQRLHALADYFDSLAVHSVASSLWAWGLVADQPALRANTCEVKQALRKQGDIWRDLLVAGLPAQSMLTPEDILKSVGTPWPMLRKYKWTVVAVVIGAAAAALGVALIVANSSTVNRAIGGFLAALGVLGITLSGLAARAKDVATGLMAQMRAAVYADLVAAATTVLPPSAHGRIKRESRGRDLRD